MQQGDTETENEHVDVPALRASFKELMSDTLAKETAKESKDNPFKTLGTVMALKLADGMVVAMVAPETVRAMLAGRRPGDRGKASASPGAPDVQTHMQWEAYDRFAVTMQKPGPGDQITLAWTRTGLSWKLPAIRKGP